jgi:hypothetical protein
MIRDRFVCVHHFRNVVTTSAGTPTCRECGREPTADEQAAGIKTLIDWEEARLKGILHPRRKR